MANEQNLVPVNKRTKSEAREISQKGGKASAQARAEKKALKDALLILLNADCNVDGEKTNGFAAIGAALFKQALGGNVKAFEVIRDTIGEKPVDTIAIDNTAEMQASYERAANAIKERTQ